MKEITVEFSSVPELEKLVSLLGRFFDTLKLRAVKDEDGKHRIEYFVDKETAQELAEMFRSFSQTAREIDRDLTIP